MQISSSEYHSFYQRYIDNAAVFLKSNQFEDSLQLALDFYRSIPSSKWNYKYVKDKWSVADILLHINDTERIMSYRALRISRGDKTPIAGFEQDEYVVSAEENMRTPKSLIDEFKSIRLASCSLFESFTDESLNQVGVASGVDISVRALKAIIIGHQIHHNQTIKERYL